MRMPCNNINLVMSHSVWSVSNRNIKHCIWETIMVLEWRFSKCKLQRWPDYSGLTRNNEDVLSTTKEKKTILNTGIRYRNSNNGINYEKNRNINSFLCSQREKTRWLEISTMEGDRTTERV